MKHLLSVAALVLSLSAMTLAGCEPSSSPRPSPTPTVAAGIANPASVYCTEKGGKSEIRTKSDGSQSGVCVFPGGSECDEWAFFRGECKAK